MVINDTLSPGINREIPTHDASWGKGGFRTFETYSQMISTPLSFLTIGTRCYCQSTEREYRWLGTKIGWMEIPEGYNNSKPIEWKGLDISEGSIKLLRKDGTKAFQICLDDDENAKMIFFDKKENAVGVLNNKLFE